MLHVEDDTGVRQVTAALLTRAGYNVEGASDGEDAWSKIAPDLGAFDLIITDCGMPFLSGLEFVKRVGERNFPGRKIVYSSGLNEAAMAEFLALGVDAVVQKGTAARVLLSEVRRIMSL